MKIFLVDKKIKGVKFYYDSNILKPMIKVKIKVKVLFKSNYIFADK